MNCYGGFAIVRKSSLPRENCRVAHDRGRDFVSSLFALFVFSIRYYRRDLRKSKWPPLLPLAVIGASGGAKSFYVATGKDTPLLVTAILLAGVFWFAVASWRILQVVRATFDEGDAVLRVRCCL